MLKSVDLSFGVPEVPHFFFFLNLHIFLRKVRTPCLSNLLQTKFYAHTRGGGRERKHKFNIAYPFVSEAFEKLSVWSLRKSAYAEHKGMQLLFSL